MKHVVYLQIKWIRSKLDKKFWKFITHNQFLPTYKRSQPTGNDKNALNFHETNIIM